MKALVRKLRQLPLIKREPIEAIETFWWRETHNFGDAINEYLFQSYGIRPIFSPVENSRMVGIGSILELIPSDYQGWIVGPGFIHERSMRRFTQAHFIAVRGMLTAERCEAPRNCLIGDPGLLVDRLVVRRPALTHFLGIVPHYIDKETLQVRTLTERANPNIKIIDVESPCHNVLKEIARCKYVLSSSLHGLITADALGIPNRQLVLSENVVGHGFKFRDYYSAFGESRDPAFIRGDEDLETLRRLTRQPPAEVRQRKSQLDAAFRLLKWHKTVD